jgi:uncharacterized protein (DUF58 family)
MSAEAAAGFRARTHHLRHAAETLSQRLPALLVEAERVAATVAPGVHGRRRTGMGETFWQFRQYQAGDAAYAIDWRQSARSRHLFIREQEWEAAESVWIWCDLSPSMLFRSNARLPLKWERAALLTLALTALLVRGGERVALLGSGERPATGRFGIETVTRSLILAAGQQAEQAPLPQLPRHARLMLLSDFLMPIERLRGRLGQFGALGARAGLMQILDPAEEELPYEGRVMFEDTEQAGSALIDHVGGIRSRYAMLLDAHRASLADLAGRQGWRFTSHRTDRTAELALLALVAMLAPRMVT